MSRVGILINNKSLPRGIMVPERKGNYFFNRLPFVSMVSPKEKLGLNPIMNRVMLNKEIMMRINKNKNNKKKKYINNRLFPIEKYRKLRTSEKFWRKNENPSIDNSFNMEKIGQKLRKRIRNLKHSLEQKNNSNYLSQRNNSDIISQRDNNYAAHKSLIINTSRKLKPLVNNKSFITKRKKIFDECKNDDENVNNVNVNIYKIRTGLKESKTTREGNQNKYYNNMRKLDNTKKEKDNNENQEKKIKENKENENNDKNQEHKIAHKVNINKIDFKKKYLDLVKKIKITEKKEKEEKEEKGEIKEEEEEKKEEKEKKNEDNNNNNKNINIFLEDNLDENINDVIAYLNELDYDKYCKDMQIREALSLLKSRIDKEKKEKETEGEEGKEEENEDEKNDNAVINEDEEKNEEEKEKMEKNDNNNNEKTEINRALNQKIPMVIVNEEELKKRDEIKKYKRAEQIAKSDKMKAIHSVNSIKKLLQREGLDNLPDNTTLKMKSIQEEPDINSNGRKIDK